MPNWRYPRFDWDDGNIDHIIDRHDVYPEEAEQVFQNQPYVRRNGAVYEVFGRSNGGRFLFLICIERIGRVRVVSARDQTRTERRIYGRHS